jgi:multidrug resistance protein
MVLGFAVGPLLFSPLSEIIGRRPVYAVSMSLYVIFNIPCALAPNIGGLLASRFLCGVFASSPLSLAGGSIADVWRTEERGLAIAYFAAAPYGGPVLGPLVNGFINIGSGRLDLIFWVNMAFAGACGLLMISIPETYAPVILKRRAQRLRKETGNQKIMTESEQVNLSFKEIAHTSLLRPLKMVVTEPVLDLMCMYVVLIYAMLYAFFFAYPVIFGTLYAFNDAIIGLMFIPILIGVAFALVVTPVTEKKFKDLCAKRDPTPEDRLIGSMIGAPFIPIALFILGATSFKHIIWVGPASSGIAFGFGMVLCYYSVNNYIIDSYQKYAASALAAKVFLRSGGGAAFPLFTVQMYNTLGLQWASWLLAFIGLGMVLIPYSFYYFGAAIRAKLARQ